MVHKRAAISVVVNFIKAIDEKEDASFLEKRDQGIAEAGQGSLAGDRSNILEKRVDWALYMLSPLAAPDENRHEIEIRQSIFAVLAAARVSVCYGEALEEKSLATSG
jgi:hypothetical protein